MKRIIRMRRQKMLKYPKFLHNSECLGYIVHLNLDDTVLHRVSTFSTIFCHLNNP